MMETISTGGGTTGTGITPVPVTTTLQPKTQLKSTYFMELANVNHDMDWCDFDDIVKYLELHLDTIINEVHHESDNKMLLIHDGMTQLYCPLSHNQSATDAAVAGSDDSPILTTSVSSFNSQQSSGTGTIDGHLILRTVSIKKDDNITCGTAGTGGRGGGLDIKREIKVHDLGIDPDNDEHHIVTIREEIVKPTSLSKSNSSPDVSENVVTVSCYRSDAKPKYFRGH